MGFPKRMVVFLLCLVLIIVALAGCLGGDSGDSGDEGDGGDDEDTGDQAGEMILKEEDMPAGWYYFNWTEIYGYEYPVWEGDYGTVAVVFFSNNESALNATEYLIVMVADFDDSTAADYWYQGMKNAYEQTMTTYALNVGDEGYYTDEDGDGTTIVMVFRNGDAGAVLVYSASDTPLTLGQVIDLAELQNANF